MTAPEVVREFEAGAFTVRMVQGNPGAGEVAGLPLRAIRGLVATVTDDGFLGRLWLGVGWCDEQFDEGWMRATAEHPERDAAIRHGLAVFGMPWSMVSLVRLDRQMFLWDSQPSWLECWEVEDLCRLRTNLFGDPMVKVARALHHCRDYARNVGGVCGELDWLR